jgi:hypothetical protein
MDPIHPILPTAPNIPPVTAAPVAARVDRDKPRQRGAGKDGRAGEERRGEADSQRRPEDDLEDDGPHIDLTA